MPARILVVEDNPMNLELMVSILDAVGHTTITACDGEEGVEAARREKPDLILMDLLMPKMDGYTAGRIIKSDPQLASIPLIAVTALSTAQDRAKAMEVGFDWYVTKPFTVRKLVDEVEALLPPELRTGFTGG